MRRDDSSTIVENAVLPNINHGEKKIERRSNDDNWLKLCLRVEDELSKQVLEIWTWDGVPFNLNPGRVTAFILVNLRLF